MPDILNIVIAAIFLPVFPLSIVFNAMLDKSKYSLSRSLLFLLWPLPGLAILLYSKAAIPGWILPLAIVTSLLYALRMLTLREVNQWSGFLATSIWSLLWIPVMQDGAAELLYLSAICMSMPMVMLVFLAAGLEQRFGAAYTGLYGGLARTIPRYSGVLVTVVVAAIATPVFPTFFIMLDLVIETVNTLPFITLGLLLIWLLWSWAGTRLIQGLIVGRASNVRIEDMGMSTIAVYSLVLIALAATGIYLSGVIL